MTLCAESWPSGAAFVKAGQPWAMEIRQEGFRYLPNEEVWQLNYVAIGHNHRHPDRTKSRCPGYPGIVRSSPEPDLRSGSTA
jgi:hypothetical protein